MKIKPSKRRIRKNGIPLNENEHKRFIQFSKRNNCFESIQYFIKNTGLYLRGRCDGPSRSGTQPCGYVFISQDSFEKGHDSLLFFDPILNNKPLNISFRKWKGSLPFSTEEWKSLDGIDHMQKNMRIIYLTPKIKLERAVLLSKLAKENFSNEFDLSIDLIK